MNILTNHKLLHLKAETTNITTNKSGYIQYAGDKVSFKSKKTEQSQENNDTLNQSKTEKKKGFSFGPNRFTAVMEVLGGVSLIVSAIFPDIVLYKKDVNVDKIDEPVPVELVIKQDAQKDATLKAIQEVIDNPGKVLVVDKLTDTTVGLNATAVDQIDLLPHEDQEVIENLKTALQDIMPGEINLKQIAQILIACSLVTGGLGQVSLGLKSNQPTEVLSGAAMTTIASAATCGDINAGLGFIYLFLGAFFSGFANNIEMEVNKKKGPKSCDLSLLKNADNWKKAMKDKKLAREMRSDLMKALKFVGNDQKKVLKASQTALLQTWQKLSGNRKELPDIVTLNPSADQRRVGAGIMYLAGALLLISTDMLGGIGFGLVTLGNVAQNANLWAMGKREEGWGKPAIMGSSLMKQLSEIALIAFPGSDALKGSLITSLAGQAELSERMGQRAKERMESEKNKKPAPEEIKKPDTR